MSRFSTLTALLGTFCLVAAFALALPGVDAFAMPFGEIPIDQNAVLSIKNLPQLVVTGQLKPCSIICHNACCFCLSASCISGFFCPIL